MIQSPRLAEVVTDKIVRSRASLLPVDERKRAGGGPKRHQPLLRVTAFDRFHGFRELFVLSLIHI